MRGRHRQQLGHDPSVGRDQERFETSRGQGNTALSQFAESNQTGGAIKPGSTAGKLDEAGQAGPDITNRESSSGGGDVVESLTTERAGPSIRSINNLVGDGLLENENLIELMKVCSNDQIGAGVVQSVLLMLKRAFLGVDGGQEANSEIAVGDQLVRRSVDKAVSSTFDPLRENDKRSKRIDLDLTGGKASRTCLKTFRDKLEIELGKSGYETASFRQRKAAWTT